MTVRTIRKTIAFRKPFYLKGVDRLLPPGDYGVVTDEELIEGLSFSAYHRISTVMFVPAQSGSAVEMVTIEPLDLEATLSKIPYRSIQILPNPRPADTRRVVRSQAAREGQ